MFKRFAADERGFTLMELLIAVAIVVILAGVGIPVYLKFQAGAKHSEASTNLNGVKLSEESYKLTNGSYLTCTASPRATPDQDAFPWAALGTSPGTFDDIGFTTSSAVRFVYAVTAATPSTFTGEALGNTDGDTDEILFICNQGEGPRLVASTDTVTLGTTSDTDD